MNHLRFGLLSLTFTFLLLATPLAATRGAWDLYWWGVGFLSFYLLAELCAAFYRWGRETR